MLIGKNKCYLRKFDYYVEKNIENYGKSYLQK